MGAVCRTPLRLWLSVEARELQAGVAPGVFDHVGEGYEP